MKKLLLIIPLQLALIFPNILMMQINYNSSNLMNGNSLNSTTNLNDTYDSNVDQAMFNWEDNPETSKSSYGYYTEKDLIDLNSLDINKEGAKEIDGHCFKYEVKIGITNKTNTYYTNESWSEEDTWGSSKENFQEDFNFHSDIEKVKNYYGIGFELKITNIGDSGILDYLNKHSLYVGQTQGDDKIGNYQKAKVKNEDDGYYFYYDNWSGMMQDNVYLNFLLVNNEEISKDKNYLTTSEIGKYDLKKYDETIEITNDEINNKTGLEKDDVNTYNNSFGIDYDNVEYYNEVETNSFHGEQFESTDFTAKFNLKWNAQTLFWKDYFYDWSNNLNFSAIYEIPVEWDEKTINVVGFTNNTNLSVSRNYAYDSNVDIKPQQNLEVNLDLYSQPQENDPNNPSIDWRGNFGVYPFILGYYDDDDKFVPVTNNENELIATEKVEEKYDGIWENIILNKPEEIHFLLFNSPRNADLNEGADDPTTFNNLFSEYENQANETILHNLVNTNDNNIYEYPFEKGTNPSPNNIYGTNATGYQNAFFIPEWDNVNHPKTKGSFYFVNLAWFIISLIISFALLILISISIIKNKKKDIEEEG